MDGGQAGEVKCGEQLRSVDFLQEALTLPRYFDLQPLLFFFFPSLWWLPRNNRTGKSYELN